MKNLTLILVSIISFMGFAQQTEQPPIIFEGVVISATEFFIDSTGKANTNTAGEYGLQSVYTTNTSYLVKVTRVLKGQEYLDTGYVEIITKLSRQHLNNAGQYENYHVKLYPGIFFTEPNSVPATLERKTNNNIVVQPYKFRPMKIDLNRRGCYGLSNSNHNICYKTKADLAKYLKEKYDIDYDTLTKGTNNEIQNDKVENNQSAIKKKSALSNGGLVKKNENYQNNLDNYNQFIANSKYKKAHQNTPTTKTTHTLHLELANETMTDSANVRFFEFDILASDNSGVYFDNCLIRLAYNTSSFGNSLVANGNVKITKGANFNSATYIDPNTNVIDQTTSVLGIPFGTDFNTIPLNRTLLSTIPQQLLHVRIVINQCNFPANIDFTDITFTPMFSFYSINANDDIVTTVSYDNTTYGSAITDELCKPIITYFTPSVATGIGDSIIIQGKYFGANRFHNNGLDSAQVRFRNADKNNLQYMQRLDTLDYLYWSDTEIRVSATSYIDGEGNSGIGTGKFIVKNKWGDTTITNSELFVEYAIENKLQTYSDKVFKKRVNLIHDTVGYVFAFNSTILNDPIKKAVTEKAIRDWACQTGVNFKILYDDNSQTANSLITFSGNITNFPDKIAYTLPSLDPYCYQNAIIRHEIAVTSFEIEMNFNTPWDYDTTGNIANNKFSYYSVLIHELGHAHQLDHVLNDNSELMRPTIALGQFRTFSPNLFAGTDDVILYNQTHIYNGCDYSPMVFGNPYCSTNSINEYDIEDYFIIYPNPFTNEFTIEFNTQNKERTEVIIYNVVGKVVYQSTQNNQNTITINLENISKGTYIVAIKTNNEIVSKRLVKTN